MLFKTLLCIKIQDQKNVFVFDYPNGLNVVNRHSKFPESGAERAVLGDILLN